MKRCIICDSTETTNVFISDFELPSDPIKYWVKDEEGNNICGLCHDAIVVLNTEFDDDNDEEDKE